MSLCAAAAPDERRDFRSTSATAMRIIDADGVSIERRDILLLEFTAKTKTMMRLHTPLTRLMVDMPAGREFQNIAASMSRA